MSAAIRTEVGRGGQVYYVSNRVKTIDDAVARVHEAAPEARVGVAHGKMSPREVEDVMIEFATKKIDVLIATTIVESGIDNATANTLIIEDSQRLVWHSSTSSRAVWAALPRRPTRTLCSRASCRSPRRPRHA